MEGVEDYLCNFSGLNGIPLNYVVRKQIIHTASSGYPYTNYITYNYEMLSRAPIVDSTAVVINYMLEIHGPFVDSYIHDYTTVWDDITAIFQEKSDWAYAKSGKKIRNGMKGYVAFFDH